MEGMPLLRPLVQSGNEVCMRVAVTAFRNLAQDQTNCKVIGKHVLEFIVKKLPMANTDAQMGDDSGGFSRNTIAALLGCIYTVVKDDYLHARWVSFDACYF